MFGIGGPELLVIFLIVLLLFGAKRLPEIARSLGKATTEFKKARRDLTTLADDVAHDDLPPPPSSQPLAPNTSGNGSDAANT